MPRFLRRKLCSVLAFAVLTACTAPATGATVTPAVLSPSPATSTLTLTVAPTQTATSIPATATPVPLPVSIVQIRMLDSKSGWAVGDVGSGPQAILRTTDGGATWLICSPTIAASTGSKVVAFFLDATTAWVSYAPQAGDAPANDVTIWHTSDSGASWTGSTIVMGAMNGEYMVPDLLGFSDASHGWVLMHMGAGMMHDWISIWTTSDAGTSWSDVVDPQSQTVPMSCYKRGLWFTSPQAAILAGDCGGVQAGLYLYATADGGASWSPLALPAPTEAKTAFTDEGWANSADLLIFNSPSWGYALVRSMEATTGKALRWVYVTTDSGKTWSPHALPSAWGNIDFVDPLHGWYVAAPSSDPSAASTIYSTSDGGANWKQLTIAKWQGHPNFVDLKTGWIVASNGSTKALVRTDDGGITWTMPTTTATK